MGAIIQTTAHVAGLADLGRALNEFGDAIEKRVLGRAVKSAGALVLADAKRRAPRGKGTKRNSAGSKIGHMADSLIVQQRKKKAGQVVSVIGSDTHSGLLHLVEFGTQPHALGKGHHPGTKAQPFLRPAIDEGGGAAIAAFSLELEKGVKQETAKAARKAAREAKARGRR